MQYVHPSIIYVTSCNKNYVIFMVLAFFLNVKIIIMFTNFIALNHVMNYERLKKKKIYEVYIFTTHKSVYSGLR